MEVYKPLEDSYFFANFLKKYLKKIKNKEKTKFLDMGSGSGILAKTAFKNKIKKENILCADINKNSTKETNLQGFKSINTNLFSKIKKENKFNIMVFNAPYLPEDKLEPKESRYITTGGKKGDEISLRFLKQAKIHLKEEGKILLLISSLTPLNRINKFKPKTVARKKIFMEELLILEFDK